MRTIELFRLETPYRETLVVEGFAFGPAAADARASVAIVGALRGNEMQQAFICANVVKRLRALEDAGALADVGILVIPVVNSFSMNIAHRFWPMDNTDINRMFPGYDAGETTQRIAAGLFDVIKDATYGIQLASYYLPGEFEPHVRITDTGVVDLAETRRLADLFGFPYALLKQPAPFDTTTLNYNWQVWGVRAFSLFSSVVDRISAGPADFVVDCIMRFLEGIGAIRPELAPAPPADAPAPCEAPAVPEAPVAPAGAQDVSRETAGNGEGAAPAPLRTGMRTGWEVSPRGPYETAFCREDALVNVRTSRAGFFKRVAAIGQRVEEGDALARILSTEDCEVIETLRAPVAGTVFFRHEAALINGETIAFKVMPA
ncbi:M14 family metallopeptidase [Adlercreutzia faecimuris]|uniref:M14 family metallopeptidase n=1 Tax=Adlercreutzia faecimuris TaxID=2897341 RepID=A0ABS9WE86_9ACTN|nr:M14 family metallopeptidase [Adlercreutzia sp. JBNU-10]MCI2240885.1 M14 family metallopeptidase [Adlercreutzia sp. JBNU-10]